MKLLVSFRRNTPFFVMILGLFAFRWSLADQYMIPTGSMEPTIHVGDRIFVNKSAYALKLPFTQIVLKEMGSPERGDIIVFDNPANGICMVKRLIGLPGDQINIQGGFVFVNGKAFDGSSEGLAQIQNEKATEVFYQEKIGTHEVLIKRLPLRLNSENFSFVVPAHKYFMMGDNRDNSLDSRAWGFLEKKDMKGRALAVFYNLNFDEHFVPRAELTRTGHILN